MSMTALGKVSLASALLLIAFAAYVHFTIGFWGDQDWELLSAHMLLDGKKLYTENFTVVPPLLFYLYTLPVALSLHMPGLQDYQALVLFSLCAIGFTILLSTRLIALHPAFKDNRDRQLQFAVLLAFLFIFRISSAFFGDREHILLVLTFPYILRWLPELSHARLSRRMRITIGIMATIGFFIKPHGLLVLAGTNLICLLRKDRPRILGSLENCVIYVLGCLYLLGIGLDMPEYFSTIMPMAMLTYSALTAGSATLFEFTLLITLGLTFAMFRPRYNSPYRKDIYYFLSVAVFLLLYAVANNGWGYTYQPLITFLLVINGFVLWEFLYLKKAALAQGLPTTSLWAGIVLCSFNFATKLIVVLFYFSAVFHHPCHGDAKCPGAYYGKLIEEVKAAPPAHSFGVIGMDYALWSRVSKLSGAEWVTRFPALWMIPKFLISNGDFTDAHKWVLYYVADALAHDLEHNKPDIVFVEVTSKFYTIQLRNPVDWIASFNSFLNFKDAWTHYDYVRTIDDCDALQPAFEVGLANMYSNYTVDKINCRYDVYRRSH